MNPQTLRGLGAMLGMLLILFLGMYFYKSYKSGEHNWYFVVMGCGMLLLLYYSVASRSGGNRRD